MKLHPIDLSRTACLGLGAMTTVLLLAPAGKAYCSGSGNNFSDCMQQQNQMFDLQRRQQQLEDQQRRIQNQQRLDSMYPMPTIGPVYR